MFTLSTVFLVLLSPPLIFLPCPLCSPSLSMWASVYLSVCVSSPLMFLACQCNGASAVNRACCSWIALCMPVLLDRQVQLACMGSTCMFLLIFFHSCALGYVCVHAGAAFLYVDAWWLSEGGRESKRSSMLLLFLQDIYNPERPDFNNSWIHGTSNIPMFYWRRERAALQDDTEWDRESALPRSVCQAFYLFVTSANNSSFTHYLFTHWFIYSFLHFSGLTLCLDHCSTSVVLNTVY